MVYNGDSIPMIKEKQKMNNENNNSNNNNNNPIFEISSKMIKHSKNSKGGSAPEPMDILMQIKAQENKK